jgi:hypothetical protein
MMPRLNDMHQTFNMKEEDVLAVKTVFDRIKENRRHTKIRNREKYYNCSVEDIFDYLVTGFHR